MEKRYSIKDIQRLTRLSPTTIKEFLTTYRDHLLGEGSPGEPSPREPSPGAAAGDVSLDQQGLERLLFIKQLSLQMRLGQEEIAQQLRTLLPRELPRRAAVEATTGANPGDGEEPAAWLTRVFSELGEEGRGLGLTVQDLLNRYTQLLKDLHEARAENRNLRCELAQVKRTQSSLVAELRVAEGPGPGGEAGPSGGRTVN